MSEPNDRNVRPGPWLSPPATCAIDDLLSRLEGVRTLGFGRAMARCPAHDDETPSLSLRLAADGRVLVHCLGGCRNDQVLSALGLGWAALFANDGRPTPRPARANETEQERAMREVLERDRHAAAMRVRWLPAWITADLVCEYTAFARITRVRATALGAKHPAVWTLLEFAATVEREALNAEVVLDLLTASRRSS